MQNHPRKPMPTREPGFRAASPAHPLSRGFTLIELLVVIAILSVLISLLLPVLSGARHEGARAKCLANMGALCKTGAAYAADFQETGAMLAVPSWWMDVEDHGFYDYGGGNGKADNMGVLGYDETGIRPARRRPLNQYIFGGSLTGHEDYRLFQCPGDTGWVDAPFYSSDSWRPQWKTRPFWQSTGTSYRANAARAARGSIMLTMSPYFRPVTRIPSPAETLLYSESIHWLARWNTYSAAHDPVQATGTSPVTIPGWHGKPGRFNIGFVDGHSATIVMDVNGMDRGLPPDNPIDPGFAHLWTRGPGPQRWRIDTRREELLPTQ